MSVTLSPAEIQQLTGYKRPADQLRELKRQGYWRARRGHVTGEVILERPHYDAVAAGLQSGSQPTSRPQARPPKLRLAT